MLTSPQTQVQTTNIKKPKAKKYQKPLIKRIVFEKKNGQLGMCKRCGCSSGSSSGG